MSSRIISLAIDRLSYGPAGVGRMNGKVVFVPGAVPGDTVEVRIKEEKKGYALGQVVTVVQPSSMRRSPPCPYVQRCGGCPWQQITYEGQLRAKEALVYEQLRRIGGMTEIPLQPIIPSPQEWRYRHRIRLRVEGNSRLGFSPPRSHEVVEIETCLIAWNDVATHLRAVREWLSSLRTPLKKIELTISKSRVAEREQILLVIGDARGAFHPADDQACRRLLAAQEAIAGVMLRGEKWRRTWGEATVLFSIADKTLVAPAGVFTQVNLAANQTLVETLVQLCGVHNEHRLVELYCGVGNLSIPLARRAQTLIGVEQNGTAVAAARANAARANLVNTQFVHASAKEGVRQLLTQGVQGDIIVLDPPRTGAAEVIDELPRFGAAAIVYVSCDPATLARDLRRLHQHGYRLRTVQPLDMFPQTYHVETIAVSVLTC
jgi:23S rRNA (uracil1939-C5)-methyltransferase